MKHHKPSEREINLSVDNPVAFHTRTQFDDDSAVLLACNSLSSSPRIQENCILAAKIGQLKPILLTSPNGKIYPFLTASNNISTVLSDEPSGTWSLPKLNNSVTEGSSTSTNADDLFKYNVSTSPIYKHIPDDEFVELSDSIVQEINKDWAFFPQLRFATSQMFAGCILLSGSTALLVNCVEPYGRLKSVDAHHERRTSSSIHQSSFPKSKSKYGQIQVCLTHDDNTTKLKIGATSCNLLITSSVHLGKQTTANKTIEIGPNTNNFIPLPDTRIYINLAHLKLGQKLLEDDDATCINQSYLFYQLRQLRSKFHCLSTYTLCRSFSSITSDISYRPYTIWTLCEYDSPQTIDSQSHRLSKMFQTIASEVIKNGSDAHVPVMLFNKLYDTLKNGAMKDTVGEIINLQENDKIMIINNLKLGSLLQTLADSLTTPIHNANQTAATLLSQHLYK